MTLSNPQDLALLGLLMLCLAFLLVSLPMFWDYLRERSDEEKAPAGVRFEPSETRSRFRSFAAAGVCALVAFWAGGFLASGSTAAGDIPKHLSYPPPVTGRNPGPGGTLRAPPAQVPVQTLAHPQPRPHVPPLVLAQALPRPTPAITPLPDSSLPEPEVFNPDELTRVDFEDVDIKAVLRFLAEKTRTNYFLDPGIQSKITVIGPREIKLSEAVTFLEAALEARGFTVVDSGTFKQVIPKAQASSADIPLYLEPQTNEGTALEKERTVTEIIQLRHAPVAEIKVAIQGLLTESSKLLEHVPTNKLILTETVRNLERLRRVIAELDVPVLGKTVFLLPVRFRKASDLVTSVTEILAKEELEKRFPQTKEIQATKPALLADAAQNLIIVVSTGPDFAKVKSLVESIDMDPAAGPEIEFLPLKNALPADVAQKITAALQTEGVPLPPFSLVADDRTQSLLLRTRSRNLRAQIKDAIRQLDQAAEQPETVQVRVYRMNFAEASKIAELLSQVDFLTGAPQSSAQVTAAGAGKNAGPKPQIKIVADENTNSLVITAPQAMFPSIERVVGELDVVKPQVLVEVLIAEVDYDWAKGRGLDFNFLNETSTNTNRGFAIGNNNQIEGIGGGGLPDGLSLGMIHGKDFNFAAAAGGDLGEISKIAGLIRLFQGTTHANILSSPTLLTSDNELARIAIGERIQLPGSFATAANTGLNTVTSFNSEDLGVILEITPRITRDDHVILKVDQSIKARTGDLLGSLETPVLSNREVSTSINALDGDTVVIGGLLSEEEQVSESRIPLLSKIPGLGKLFRSKSRNTRKTNLMIFLTPHIVRGETEARHITERSRQEISQEIERSLASEGATIREVFAPGRSLGRFRIEESNTTRRPVGVVVSDPEREAAGEVDRRIDEIFHRLKTRQEPEDRVQIPESSWTRRGEGVGS